MILELSKFNTLCWFIMFLLSNIKNKEVSFNDKSKESYKEMKFF